MFNKRKLEHIGPGLTKGQGSHQQLLLNLMSKLIEQSRQNNNLLREVLGKDQRYARASQVEPRLSLNPLIRRTETHLTQQPLTRSRNLLGQLSTPNPPVIVGTSNHLELKRKTTQKIHSQISNESQEGELRNVMVHLQTGMKDIANTNKKLLEKLVEMEEQKAEPNILKNLLGKVESKDQAKLDEYGVNLLKILNKKEKEKKSYASYGIISEIMPFSDKREMKVRFRIFDLLDSSDLQKQLPIALIKSKTTEWVGMVYRATASICWNMLLGGSLTFQQVKVLFTENIIFNFIEFMNDIELYLDEDKRYELAEHINNVSCDVLEFLCKQYPQTKVQAPNIALRKSIPLIENQGQAKFDLIAMVCRQGIKKLTQREQVEFQVRDDKDYSSVIMNTINFMIDKTEEQYDHFEKTMTNIFETIFIPKEKRNTRPYASNTAVRDPALNEDAQYREKVMSYSSYLIGRKIPKNTPKYSDNEIQYGVFFVKAPSVLRIITKWFEQLWEFSLQPEDKGKSNSREIKDHSGKVLNISTRVKRMLLQKVKERFKCIQDKIERIRQQCYMMQLLLTNSEYISDEKQVHLSEDQLGVGKYCSNLRNAISSYVCAQLSKIIYELLIIPTLIDENSLNFTDEDFLQQARKHLSNTNLVTLKIFDLLRCKCHSNEQQIIAIVEALKQLERDDEKFEIVRVKDRLNQGTRDILINAQYDGGLIWEIQLAVTSHVDKKQDLLDKYNHFLYELKRNKLGPLSECVSIWATLEQRSTYFEQAHLKRKETYKIEEIKHRKTDCKLDDFSEFSEFKRPIICGGCRQYFSIPLTSLLNVRCEKCRITYCGQCFYFSLSELQRKKFMFQNFDKKKLMSSVAFQELVQYCDFKLPFPREGFFIKKKFLNRELSYYTAVRMDQERSQGDSRQQEFEIVLSQTIVRNNTVDIRRIHRKEIKVKEVNGQYYLKSGFSQLNDFWFFYFRNRKSETIPLAQLEAELKDSNNTKMKYLNVLHEPNYMKELKLTKKQFEKMRLLTSIKDIDQVEDYRIAVHRFPHLLVLAKLQVQENLLKDLLIKKENRATIRGFIEKKVTIITMEQCNLSDEINYFTNIKNDDVAHYLLRIQKLYLADNNLKEVTCLDRLKNLESLSLAKNYITSLNGLQNLSKLFYVKFDDNEVESLLPLKKLMNLTYISGNSNKITSLQGIESLHQLSTLALSENKLMNLTQLNGLSELKRIYLRNNPLSNLQPLKDICFVNLFIGATNIKPMDIAGFNFLDKLKELSLKDLNMMVIPRMFTKMKSLTELKLNKNNINKIENLETLTTLTILDLSDNNIEKLENLSTLINLEELKLKRNKITVVQGVKTFIESLRNLQLQENPLNDLQDYLVYQERLLFMRLKYSEDIITQQAKKQLKNFAMEIGNRSENDD